MSHVFNISIDNEFREHLLLAKEPDLVESLVSGLDLILTESLVTGRLEESQGTLGVPFFLDLVGDNDFLGESGGASSGPRGDLLRVAGLDRIPSEVFLGDLDARGSGFVLIMFVGRPYKVRVYYGKKN